MGLVPFERRLTRFTGFRLIAGVLLIASISIECGGLCDPRPVEAQAVLLAILAVASFDLRLADAAFSDFDAIA